MRPHDRLRCFYLAYYGAVGSTLPYFAPYLRGLGFTGAEIGAVQILGPLLAAPVALGWAAVADRLGSPKRALELAAVTAVLAYAYVPFAHTAWLIGVLLFLQSLGERAVVPLVDSATMEWTRVHPRPGYARIRLFGSLGYVLAAQGLGLALTARGERAADRLVPLTILGCGVAYALLAFRVPALPPPAQRARARDLPALLTRPGVAALLTVCTVHWIALAPYHLLFGVYVRDLALPAGVTGASMTAGVGAEILGLLVFPWLEKRVPLRAIFAGVFVASAARWLATAQVHAAAPLVALQSLHGITFGVFWGAAVASMAHLVPSRQRTGGQALFSAIVFGLGNAVGYQLSGLGYDRFHGAGPLYTAGALVEGLALAATLLLPAHLENRAPSPAVE